MSFYDRDATSQAKDAMAQTMTLAGFAIATFKHNVKMRCIDAEPALCDAEQQLDRLIEQMKAEALVELHLAASKAS